MIRLVLVNSAQNSANRASLPPNQKFHSKVNDEYRSISGECKPIVTDSTMRSYLPS